MSKFRELSHLATTQLANHLAMKAECEDVGGLLKKQLATRWEIPHQYLLRCHVDSNLELCWDDGVGLGTPGLLHLEASQFAFAVAIRFIREDGRIWVDVALKLEIRKLEDRFQLTYGDKDYPVDPKSVESFESLLEGIYADLKSSFQQPPDVKGKVFGFRPGGKT